MDEKTTKLIKERFDSLPESVKEVILSSDYESTLLDIGKQYNLNVEKLDILERETTLVMMGLTPTKDFENELTRELGIDKEKGSQIVKDINEKVFLKIRDLLKLMNTPQGEKPSLEESTEEENENKILHSSGIEILNGNQKEIMPPAEKLELNANQPILAQKLTGFVKNEVKETDHALDNLTKTASAPVGPGVNKIPHTDPYREIPE